VRGSSSGRAPAPPPPARYPEDSEAGNGPNRSAAKAAATCAAASLAAAAKAASDAASQHNPDSAVLCDEVVQNMANNPSMALVRLLAGMSGMPPGVPWQIARQLTTADPACILVVTQLHSFHTSEVLWNHFMRYGAVCRALVSEANENNESASANALNGLPSDGFFVGYVVMTDAQAARRVLCQQQHVIDRYQVYVRPYIAADDPHVQGPSSYFQQTHNSMHSGMHSSMDSTTTGSGSRRLDGGTQNEESSNSGQSIMDTEGFLPADEYAEGVPYDGAFAGEDFLTESL